MSMNSMNRDEYCEGVWKKYRHTNEGKVIAGIWVVIVGGILLTRQLGFEYPSWLFTWPVLLITIGIYISARHLFSNPGGYILIIIGSLFLFDNLTPNLQLSEYIWPLVIMLIGFAMIFKPNRRKQFRNEMANSIPNSDQSNHDLLETISIFGGVKKNILSKNFKGGEVVCIFGGAEINLMQADFEGRITLEIIQVLGGTKLIIPSNWDVQPEMVAVLGGIEDKRQIHPGQVSDKVLVIKGASVLGGIEIKSY